MQADPTDLKRFDELTPPGRWLVSWAFVWRALTLLIIGSLLLENSAHLGYLMHQMAPNSLPDRLADALGWLALGLCGLEPFWTLFWAAKANFGPYRLLCLDQGELKAVYEISAGKAFRIYSDLGLRLSLAEGVLLLATITAAGVFGAGRHGSVLLWAASFLLGFILSAPSFYKAISKSLNRQYGTSSLRFVAGLG